MTEQPEVELVDEPVYTFGSADNPRSYRNERHLNPGSRPWSIHGLLIDSEPILVIGAGGGATGVHDRSLIQVGDVVYFAVGPYVCRFALGSIDLDWDLRVDDATCFGIHYNEASDTLIAHGELAISRFSHTGEFVWTKHGADIFTGRVSLHDDHVEAIDFNQQHYRFSNESGNP